MGEERRFRRARGGLRGDRGALQHLLARGGELHLAQAGGPGEDPLEVGECRYAREDTVFSYKNCVVAEHNGEMIGMPVAFPMETEPEPGEPEGEEDPVLTPYGELERPGSYYVCGMALFPEHRGLGARMLGLAREEARRRGLAEMSLIVFEQNAGAKRLNERHGFREVARRPVVPHQLIRYTGDALLMVAEVA